MEIELKEKLVEALNTLRDEFNKRDIFYEHGIDMCNYDKEYLNTLENLISFLIGGDCKEEVSWWIYDCSDKIYHMKEGEKEFTVDVENAEDFINFLIKQQKLKDEKV